jgi:uridine kinase
MNSFMPSELVLMKGRLGEYFPDFIRSLEGDPERTDALDRAQRVQRLFDALPDFDGDDYIPTDSLLREFIGGSVYDY